jgi:uncharacterized protein YfaS (alpha-2-macroglobulin family)
MKKFTERLSFFLKTILGSAHYQPPEWFKKVFLKFKESRSGQRIAVFRYKVVQNPRKAALLFFGAVLICGLSVLMVYKIQDYYDSLPKPTYVTFSHYDPGPTDPETLEPNSLVVNFDRSAANLEDLNKVISKGLKIYPEVLGSWRWTSDSSLKFVPIGHGQARGDWQIGTEYKVTFEKTLFPKHVMLKEYGFSFKTQGLKAFIDKEEFYIDPLNPNVKRVVVSLKYNYPIDSESIKKHIKFTLQDRDGISVSKDVPFNVTFNKFLTEVYLQSDPIAIPRNEQMMTIAVEKGVRVKSKEGESKDELKIEVAIPSLYKAFKIKDVSSSFVRNEKFEPEQILLIETTLDANSEELAKKMKVFQLPADRPAFGEEKELKDYHWNSISEITEDIQKKMTPVIVKLVPGERAVSKLHTFKLQVTPERSLLVKIAKGLIAQGGYELLNDEERIQFIENYPHELSFMGDGSVLSLSGDLKLPLLGRNLNEVEFEIMRVIPEQVNHLMKNLSDSGKDVKRPYLGEQLHNSIAQRFQLKLDMQLKSPAATQYFSLDLEPYVNKMTSAKGVFVVRAVGRTNKYGQVKEDERLILITDIGILVKATVAKHKEVYVQNFRSGLPIEGALVEVIGMNGLPVISMMSDSLGHVTLPNFKDFTREKQPIAIVVKKAEDSSYLPLNNYSRALQYSRFDIGGIFESSTSDELKAMMFSDRGMYRPGEKVSLGAIVRSKSGKRDFKKLPVSWSVTNPQGNEILNELIEVNASDLKSLDFATEYTYPTGVYSVSMFLINKDKSKEQIGQLEVRVEEFLQDRLKVKTNLSQEKLQGWIKPQGLAAQVNLQNLFGTAAEQRRVIGKYTLTPSSPSFKDYNEYIFTNPNRSDLQPYTETLNEATTDTKGLAEFAVDLNKYNGTLYHLRFEAEAFESEGGRSVFAASNVLVSPLDFLIGAKPDGDLTYIKKDSERSLVLIAINSDLKKIAAENVEVELSERKFISVLIKQSDGTFKYQSVLKETPLKTQKIKIAAIGAKFKIESQNPGDYVLNFRLAGGGSEILRINYTITGDSNLSRSLERNAELQVALNKKDFKPNEEIEMQIRAPYHGSGLITIERDGVYSAKWFKTETNAAVETIKIPEGLEGNAYINVAFIRAMDSKEIFTSPLSYAIAPFSISLDEHKTQIILKTPDKVKPGQSLKIVYSTNRKTSLILYGVDEGILQVAKYKTPDPLTFFFQKRALQVRTFQLLDLLLPEFSIIQQMQASGGDEGFRAIGKNLNPFKARRLPPIAFWSGVLSADNIPKNYTYEVPDYFNGNLKIMAVASTEGGLGSTESATLVRGDFILSPSTPVFVAPGDEFNVGVGISNQLAGSGEKAPVSAKVIVSDHFEAVGTNSQQVAISEGHEGQVVFKIRAKSRLGEGGVDFIAEAKGKTAHFKSIMSVRPAMPYVNIFESGLVENLPLNFENKYSFYTEFSKMNLSFSALPLVLSYGLIQYLDTYPYGCTEQIISKAFPSLILRTRQEFLPNPEKARDIFESTIQTLRTRQSSSGGFALYSPRYESVSPMASLYAIHYLIEAKERNLDVPKDMLARVKQYLSSETKGTQNLGQLRRWSYATYLLARLGTVDGASVSDLQMILEKNYKEQWRNDAVALFLAATYKLYKQDELGNSLMRAQSLGVAKVFDYEDYQDNYVHDSQLLYVAARHFPDRLKDLVSNESMKKFIAPLMAGNYNTHSSAWVILALDAIANNAPLASIGALKVEASTINDKKEEAYNSIAPSKKQVLQYALPFFHKKVRANGDLKMPLFYLYSLSGFPAKSPDKEVKNGLELIRLYMDKEGKEIRQAELGDEIEVHLRVRSTDNETHPHIAMVDLLPGGFELIINKPTESESTGEYQNDSGGNDDNDDPGSGDNDDPGRGYNKEGEGEETDTESGDGASLDLFLQKLLLPKAYAEAQASVSLARLSPEFVDEREDRVVIYATVNPQVGEYIYRIKAVNQGRFITPPAFAESIDLFIS